MSHLRIVILAVICTGASIAARAQTSVAETLSIPSHTTWQPHAAFEMSGGLSKTETNRNSYSGLYRLSAGLSYVPLKITGIVEGGYVREYSYTTEHGEEGYFENTLVAIKKSLPINKGLLKAVSFGLSSHIPTSREASRRTFRGSVGPTASAEFKWRRLSVGQGIGYYFGLYGYDIRDDGTVNSPHVFTFTTSASFAFLEKLSLDAAYVYKYSISYQSVARAVQLTSVGLTYNIQEKWSMSAGFENEQGTLDASGQVREFRFVNEDGAAYFLSTRLSI